MGASLLALVKSIYYKELAKPKLEASTLLIYLKQWTLKEEAWTRWKEIEKFLINFRREKMTNFRKIIS